MLGQAHERSLFIYLFYNIAFIYVFIVWLGRGILWHLQKFLQCIKYIILGFTPSPGEELILNVGLAITFKVLYFMLSHLSHVFL
jgi:hypothetical protein